MQMRNFRCRGIFLIEKGQRVRVRGIFELQFIVQADDAGNDQPGS